ncbi:MAG TPA: hypothetical protein VHP14_08990, partial [Anaerolineales bacterium]|nr:hypothetical protein [Anaerolineales bacterium]
LRGLAAACTQLGNHEKAGSLKRVLEGGTDNLLKVLREMEDCQRILIAIDPAGHIWKNKCLAEGKWEEAHKFLKQLSESILGGGHEAVVELSERINTHTAVRRALNDLKEDIRSALSGDDFEQGQALCDELDTALQNNMELNGVAFQFPPFDPYQIVQKDWREFDLFSRKRIPYFGATPDPPMPPEPDFERMIIRQVFQTRQENLKNWERVHQDILREHHRLVEAAGSVEEIRPRRQPSHPTRGQLDKVIAYENDCKTTHGHCEAKVATVPEPLSRKAESLQRTCKRLVDEIKDQQGFATKDRLSLEADEQKVQQEIDLAVEALEKKQDGKATGYISAADEFYEDSPDNPNRDFIKHLSDILIETPQEK